MSHSTAPKQTESSPTRLERWIRAFPKGSIWQTRFICLPALIIVATWAFSSARFDDFGTLSKTLYFVAGAAVWTLLEYVLHRWVLHYQPKSAVGRALLDRLHIFHHQDRYFLFLDRIKKVQNGIYCSFHFHQKLFSHFSCEALISDFS